MMRLPVDMKRHRLEAHRSMLPCLDLSCAGCLEGPSRRRISRRLPRQRTTSCRPPPNKHADPGAAGHDVQTSISRTAFQDDAVAPGKCFIGLGSLSPSPLVGEGGRPVAKRRGGRMRGVGRAASVDEIATGSADVSCSKFGAKTETSNAMSTPRDQVDDEHEKSQADVRRSDQHPLVRSRRPSLRSGRRAAFSPQGAKEARCTRLGRPSTPPLRCGGRPRSAGPSVAEQAFPTGFAPCRSRAPADPA